MSVVKNEIFTGELLDDAMLSLEQLAGACHVERQWVIERLEAGILKTKHHYEGQLFFVSEDLIRARRLAFIEQNFDADAELAALVADLIEEVNQLKQQLKVVSASDSLG
jgi:chaperone modulatory protein CbpM